MRIREWNEHPEARSELADEAAHLPPSLADELADRVVAAVQDIIDRPNAWPIVPYWDETPVLRWRAVRPFRIRVVYYIASGEVRVIAYAHEAREPRYWRLRLAV